MRLRVTTAFGLAGAILLTSYLTRLAVLRPLTDESGGLVLDSPLAIVVACSLAAGVVLALALIVDTASGGMKWMRPAVHRAHRYALALSVLIGFSGVGIALVPKAREAPSTSLLNPPELITQIPPLTVQHPVFFANGSAQLDGAQRTITRSFLVALADCPMAQVLVLGFASSAPYSGDSTGDRNLQLAEKRADAIVSLALEKRVASASARKWNNLAEMQAERRIRDQAASGDRLILREYLNRRADIQITLPAECVN